MTEEGVLRHESDKPRVEITESRGIPRGEPTESRREPTELGIEEDKIQQAIFSKYAESEDLDSWDSNDEEHGAIFDVFKEETVMANIQFKLEMKFKSFELLKRAMREHAITRGHNVRLVKNDKTRMRAIYQKNYN